MSIDVTYIENEQQIEVFNWGELFGVALTKGSEDIDEDSEDWNDFDD